VPIFTDLLVMQVLCVVTSVVYCVGIGIFSVFYCPAQSVP
jgi:hypothetical protein